MKIRKQFKAPWDWLLITITTVCLTLLFIGGFLSQNLAIIILLTGISLLAASLGVYGYSIHDQLLEIKRLGWSTHIDLSDIKNIEYSPNAMSGSLRLLGIGGVFGFIGYFKNRSLGKYRAYATHRQKTVIITTNMNDQIVVTPDDPQAFVQSVKAANG
jgi:hypothetical protein